MSTFGFCGISEISHGRRTAFGFSPVDPEAQLFSIGQIDHSGFGAILAERLVNTREMAAQSGQRLLVREHTHNYFFNADCPEVVPKGPSWVADQFGSQIPSIDTPVVVTVRDPIDSWLGFRQNFNHLQPDRFEDYCAKYNQFFDRVESWQKRGKPIHVFKYEDCVVDAESAMRGVAQFLNVEFAGLDVSDAFKTVSSGNSGRQSASLAIRKRRPFTMSLVKAARDSFEYSSLCTRLGYEPLHSNMTFSNRVSASFYSMLLPIRKIGNMVEAPGRWIYKQIRSGRGIQ